MPKKKAIDRIYEYFEENPVLGYMALVVAIGVVTYVLTLMGL